ncbi:hypothetical protein D3C77_761500 [compost metagenome]
MLAALLSLRCCTSRLAVIRVSDSFSASSRDDVWASARPGVRAMARAKRDSFIGKKSSKDRSTFEEGRNKRGIRDTGSRA